MKEKLKADILIIGSVLVLALLIMLIPRFFTGNMPAEAVIFRDKTEIGRYSLLQDETITISDEEGGYNLVMINDGMVQITDADCPDKLCVKQSTISNHGESIICLPHKLVIQIISGKESGIDAMTN